MDKQTVVHPYNGILLINKRNNVLVVTATWMNLKGIMLRKGSQA